MAPPRKSNPTSWGGSEERRQKFLSYQKQRKKAFKEKGICPNCEKRPAAENRVCCASCLEDKKLAIKFGAAGPYRQLYADMFERQLGLCGICGQAMARPILDYCRRTMVVRGLLCSSCNIGLGQFKDDAELLKKAIKYLLENAGVGIELRKQKSN